ncbi:MAG: PH domain-containing protein [Alphaproteobacteria bacterium]|nr:PH domain-containing protein [Alphaproteobacteria bacterium]
MREFEHEPIRGLPERLPEGERILWQGAPSFAGLARGAFRMREVAVYFALLGAAKAAYALATGVGAGGAALEFFGMAAPAALTLGVLAGLAALSARSTVYTVTDKRVVFRFGMALEKAVNVPFAAIAGAAVKADRDGRGDIALALTPRSRVSYLAFWPHVRPFRYGRAEPSLRGLADVRGVASILASALAEAQPALAARAASAQAASPAPEPVPAGVTPASIPPRMAPPVGAAHPA